MLTGELSDMFWQKCISGILIDNSRIDQIREEDAEEAHGHITSLAVSRTYRKLGLATKLMNQAREFTKYFLLLDFKQKRPWLKYSMHLMCPFTFVLQTVLPFIYIGKHLDFGLKPFSTCSSPINNTKQGCRSRRQILCRWRKCVLYEERTPRTNH
jgi:hypothetical protein